MKPYANRTYSRSLLLASVGFLTVVLVVHGTYIAREIERLHEVYGSTSFEDLTLSRGDATPLLGAVQSLFEMDIEKKLNHRPHFVIPPERVVVRTEIPESKAWILRFHPIPSLRVGHSWLGFALSGWVPKWIFERVIPRLIFVNLILNLFILSGVFVVSAKVLGSIPGAFFLASIAMLDVPFVYNSYSYQSHTSAGLACLFASLWLYFCDLKRPVLTSFLVMFFCSLGVLAGSHVLPLNLFLGVGTFLFTLRKEAGGSRFKCLLAGICGFFILPMYLLISERVISFSSLGIPTYVNELKVYQFITSNLIQSFPVFHRFLWDYRLVNIFIVPILLLVGVFAVRMFRQKMFLQGEHKWMLWAVALAFFVTIVHGLPVSRGATPFSILFSVGLATLIWQGSQKQRGRALVLSAMICLFFINFLFTLGFLDTQTRDEVRVSLKRGAITVQDLLKVTESIPENVLITLDPMELVEHYSWDRRFFSTVLTRGGGVIDRATVERDFPLLVQLSMARRNGSLPEFRAETREHWNFALWDQELNYVMGYQNGIRRYLQGGALEDLDCRLLYKVDLASLRRVFGIDFPRTLTRS